MKRSCHLIILFILLFLSFFIIHKNKHILYNISKNNTKLINDDIIYIQNFLTDKEYKQLQKLLQNDTYPMKNEKFRLAKPLFDKPYYDLFYSSQKIKHLQTYINPIIFQSDFPIEYREYPLQSKGMNWHKDTLLYQKPQYEAIYTIDNTSDSYTQWIDDDGNLQYIWTEPNSILLVKAQGLLHNVTPLTQGVRNILKLIYTQTNEKTPLYHKEMKRFN